MASPMTPLRWTTFALAGVAFLLLLAVQFVPFATFTTSFFGATADVDAYAWEAKFRAEGFGNESSDQTSWYDNDFDDEEGIGMVRPAPPLLAAGCLLGLLTAFAALRMPGLAAAGGFVGAGLAGTGTYLMARGVKELLDGQQEWSWAFYFAIAAGVLLLASGVLALVARQREPAPAS